MDLAAFGMVASFLKRLARRAEADGTAAPDSPGGGAAQSHAPDTGGPGAPPAAGMLSGWSRARRGLRLRTLILQRWVSLAGQAALLLFVTLRLNFRPPLAGCLAVIVAAAAFNFAMTVLRPQMRVAGRREALAQLAFDIAELTAVLALTGGLSNPFSLLLVAPVSVAAATLEKGIAVAVAGLALLATAFLYGFAAPLPWTPGAPLALPALYLSIVWAALATGIVFGGVYAWQAQSEAQRMELALVVTEAVLAREQRLSALGGLAAAAAHELGTPLATIQVVTKEMLRAAAVGSTLHEDVSLLVSQAERCRDILRRLSHSPEASDVRHSRMSLSQLMEEISAPHRDGVARIEADVTCAVGAAILEVRRQPEVLHGLSAFVENAVDFAESIVEVSAYYDAQRLVIEVRDDGPGFPSEVMARLGEPYVTTRPHAEGSRSGHLGMGLGFFIAKTLLERTGASVEFRNARRGGAVVCARWARAKVEAPPAEV